MTPHRRVRLARPVPSPLAADFARIREQFDVTSDFPEAVEDAADAAGHEASASVRRALVRSRDRLDYAHLDGERETILHEIAERRIALARVRGAVALNAPEQRVVPDSGLACGYRLEWESRMASED